MPTDTFRPVPHDMVRGHLAVHQTAAARFQPFHQPDQRQLGRMGPEVEHGFPEESPSEADAVQAADKFVAVPRFDGVGMAELVQPDVGVHHFGHDPRTVLIRARGGRAPEHDQSLSCMYSL